MDANTIKFTLSVLCILGSVFYIGFAFGRSTGLDEGLEIVRKAECEVEFSGKPLNEVPVRCLKYFNLNQNIKGQVK